VYLNRFGEEHTLIQQQQNAYTDVISVGLASAGTYVAPSLKNAGWAAILGVECLCAKLN